MAGITTGARRGICTGGGLITGITSIEGICNGNITSTINTRNGAVTITVAGGR